jgi:hypothetical protein
MHPGGPFGHGGVGMVRVTSCNAGRNLITTNLLGRVAALATPTPVSATPATTSPAPSHANRR